MYPPSLPEEKIEIHCQEFRTSENDPTEVQLSKRNEKIINTFCYFPETRGILEF